MNDETPHLIPFEIGVILTTETEWVFKQQVESHPGALSIFKNIAQTEGLCEHSRCHMGLFQEHLKELFENRGGNDRCVDFFNRALRFEGRTPTDDEVSAVLREMNHDAGQQRDKGDPLLEAVQALFPGSKVIRLG